jgi:tetratricopeptide (TPR) repeat protein
LKSFESGSQNYNRDNLHYNNNINKIRAIEIYKEANTMFYNKNYSKCIIALKEALELYPDYANSIALISRAYRVVGDNKLMKSFAKKALKLNYDKKDPYMCELRGLSYLVIKKYEMALKEFNKAIALDPNSCAAIRLKGLCLSLTGKYKRGIKYTNTAISKCPDDYATYLTRGIAHYVSKKYDKAIRDYEKALEMYPESGYCYYRMSLAYKMKGDRKNSVRYCKNSCELNYLAACKICGD